MTKTFILVVLLAFPAFSFNVRTSQDPPSNQQGSTITEISLEMAQGSLEKGKPLGRAFKVTLRRDGTALFEGKANVKLIGKYRGTIPAADFDALADLLISKRYHRINDELPQRFTPAAGEIRVTPYDSPVVTTTVLEDGKQKTIRRITIVTSEYKRRIPPEITEIENAITDAAMKIRWSKIEE